MPYMIFEIQEGNLVLTDPNAKPFTRTREQSEAIKLSDPLRNTTDEDYTDFVADMADYGGEEIPMLDDLSW